MSRNESNDFLPNHGRLADDVLTKASGELTEPVMFVATFEAKLNNISIPMHDAIDMIDCRYPIVAINCNFGHKCLEGYERYLKTKPGKTIGTRKGQGDRTCFNSALEPVYIPDRADLPPSKVYYPKLFPSTGEVQVPGSLMPDMSDSMEAVNVLVDLLNYHGLGNADEHGDPMPITIKTARPNMINFKFRIKRASPRILLDLYSLGAYFEVLEKRKIVVGNVLRGDEADKVLDDLPHGTTLIPPPFVIRETKPPIEDVKLTFKFRRIRIKIFMRGKINILGADSFESANKIHQYMSELLRTNHSKFIRIQPKSDSEHRTKNQTGNDTSDKIVPALVPIAPPVYRLTDNDIDEILGENAPPGAVKISEAPSGDITWSTTSAADEPDGDGNASSATVTRVLAISALGGLGKYLSEFADYEDAEGSGDDGDLDDIGVDHVNGQDEEDHKKEADPANQEHA